MRLLFSSLIVVVVLAFTSATSRAGYEYTFDASNYTVAVGSTVNVNVYLTQTGSDTGLSATSLASGGVQLNYNPAFVANNAISPNNTTSSGSSPTGFDSSNNITTIGNGSNGLPVGSSLVGVSQNIPPESAVKAGSGSPNTSTSILLGTFQFTGVSAGTSLIVSTNSFPGQDVNVLADGTVLDGMISNSSAVITVTAVPEPGTLALTGLLVTGIAGGYLRRRSRLVSA